jgi:hypothetical protein
MPLWSSVRESDAQSTPSLARVRAPGERVPARRLALSASFRMPCGVYFSFHSRTRSGCACYF